MSVFRTQRLTNKFPRWAKVRYDPSSMGARILSVFSEYFDFRSTELLKLKTEMNLLRPHLGRASAWRLQLVDDDLLPVDTTTGGLTTWTYPTTVTGTHALGSKTLTRVENLEDLLWSAPEEVSLSETIATTNLLIWESSAPETYNTMSYSERLTIVVENSTDYFARGRFKNRNASGFHFVEVEGKDINGSPFTELVHIRDDGLFTTKNILSELTKIRVEGLNGDVKIYLNTPITATRMLTDMYHIAMSMDTEGPLKLALDTDIVKYYVQHIMAGANYRTGASSVVDNDELVWSQVLADTGGTALTGIVDLAVNFDTSRLYALQSNGKVWVYDHGITPFSVPLSTTHTVTNDTFVTLQPLRHWASLNETMKMFTNFLHPRFPVVSVQIMRRSPAGIEEYLQADKVTWAAGVYSHLGKGTERKLPEESWADFGFTSLFDEYGQWEFYSVARTTGGSSVTYTGVMVDKLTALSELTTAVGTPTGLYFSENGQLSVTDASNVYRFEEHVHGYLADGGTQQLFFREDYSSVEVTL